MKLKRRTKLERVKDAPKAGLTKARGGAKKTAGKKVRGQTEMVASRLEPYAEGARKAVADRAAEAWEWAEPRLEHAAETAQDTYQKDIAPRVSTALSTAAERSAPAREEALERGTAAVAALKGEGHAKPKRRWPLAILFFLIGGAIGAAGGVFGKRFMPDETLSADYGRSSGTPAGSRPGAHRETPSDGAAPSGTPPHGV